MDGRKNVYSQVTQFEDWDAKWGTEERALEAKLMSYIEQNLSKGKRLMRFQTPHEKVLVPEAVQTAISGRYWAAGWERVDFRNSRDMGGEYISIHVVARES